MSTKFRGVSGFFREIGVKIGIELELFMENSDMVRQRTGWFQFGGDASISPEFGRGIELRTPPLSYRHLSKPYTELKKIKEITNVGVNASCGTHIHISFSNTHIPFYELIDTMAAAEGFFYSLGGRRGNGRISGGHSYARPVRSKIFLHSPVARRHNKFFSIHLYNESPLRLEVRAFAGTANPTRLVLYQASVIGVAMLAYRRNLEKYRNPKDGMLLTNEHFHNPLSALKTWIEILDWKEGGRWTGFWYNVRRPTKGLPDEEKLLKWLANALANFTRGFSKKEIEHAYMEVEELIGRRGYQ